MHSTIKHKPMPANLKIIRIRADLRAPCEVNEFHCPLKVKALKRRSGHMQEQRCANGAVCGLWMFGTTRAAAALNASAV